MKDFYLLLTIVFSIALIFQFFLLLFRPTKYWWIKKLRLYKLLPEFFPNLETENIREIEYLLEDLIIQRCSDENKIIEEIRNGYLLKYYPKGVLKNKRYWRFDYVEIYDADVLVTLRVGFNLNNSPEYQIEHRQTYESILRIFLKSNQGNVSDFKKLFKRSKDKMEIIKKYRDFLIKDIL